MNFRRHERDLLIRYLLHRLPEAEREKVDDRLFSDQQFADELEDTERDLLDAYVRGELNAADRAAVASHLLASEHQQEKLAFARAWAARSPVAKKMSVLPFLALAAVVVLAVGGGFLLHKSPAQAEVAQQPVSGPMVEPAPTPKQLPLPPPVQAPKVFAAFLVPGSLRDGDVQMVSVPHDTTDIRLDLQLADLNSKSYSARLVRQRETVFHQDGLEAHQEGNTPLLSVTVPSAVLTDGQYRLYISPGVTYYFRVQRKM